LLAVNTLVRSSTRTATCSASGTWWTPTGARCPKVWATSSIRGRSSTPAVPIPCGGGCSPGLPVDTDPGQLRRHRLGHAGQPADPVEHLVVLHHLRLIERLRPRRSVRSGAGRPVGPRPVDAVRLHATVATVTTASTATSPFRPPPPSPPSSTTPPTGTCAAAVAASGAPTPTPTPPTPSAPRPPCTRSW